MPLASHVRRVGTPKPIVPYEDRVERWRPPRLVGRCVCGHPAMAHRIEGRHEWCGSCGCSMVEVEGRGHG